MTADDRASGLARVSILAQLSPAELTKLAQECGWRQYGPGEQIFGRQDSSTNVFFLLAGKVRAISYSRDGKAVVFADLAPGAMFGEIAALDRRPRSASVEALETSTVASLAAERFEQLMFRAPSVAIATLRHVAADVRRLSERVFEFSTLAVQNRIQAELLRLANSARMQHSQAILSPAPSLSDIANRISTHREAVSRELSRLTTIGLLRRDKGDLVITDVGKLFEFVSEAKGE